MKKSFRVGKKWTVEKCCEVAKDFETKRDFRRSNPKAYWAANRLGCLSLACAHMKILGDRCYRYVYVFTHSDQSVYVGLSFDPWTRYKIHMRAGGEIERRSKEPGQSFRVLPTLYPSKKAARKEAELIEDYRRKGWIVLNKVKGGNLGANHRQWTYEKCRSEAKKYKTRKEFKDNCNGGFQAADSKGWLGEICGHMTYLRKPSYSFKDLEKEANKFSTRAKFCSESSAAFQAAKRRGILDVLCSHMKKKQQMRRTNKELLDILAAYNSKVKLQREKKGVYLALMRRGLLAKAFPKSTNELWSLEKIIKLAKRYKTSADFRKNNKKAYAAAVNRGWLPELYRIAGLTKHH